jgi:hypothetical protein
LKEKLSQLHTNEDGILEGIGGPVKYEDCKLPRYIPTGQDGIPTKRQLSNTSEESKSTTTGSYESEITNDQWYILFNFHIKASLLYTFIDNIPIKF